MAPIFFLLAAIFFFFPVAGIAIMANPTAWGLLALALGLLCGNWAPFQWRK